MAADLGAGWSRSKISKIENGRQMPSEDDIRAWADECGASDAVPELLVALGEVQAVQRRWRQELRRGHAAIQTDLDQRLRGAALIRNAEIAVIPGLLQTSAYALSLATEIAGVYGIANEGINASVAARMRRQEILYDGAKRFEFVITEAALRLLPCPPQVMLGQLDRLLSLGLGNITLGIVPFGVHLTMTPVHGFLIVDDATIIETYSSETELTGADSEAYGMIFGRLMAEAVTGDDARRLIASAADHLRS
jgi:transcriptional regulator with XRE-family HTH domain